MYSNNVSYKYSMKGIGVIGSGGMGSRHIINLARQTPAQVVAIMDIDPERASRAADAIAGGCKVLTDANALITDPSVGAVLIASPHRFHAEAALACIEAGKPVLCEKPLATSLADAKKVLDAEMAGGKRLLQLGFMREYDPAHKAVKECAARGYFTNCSCFAASIAALDWGHVARQKMSS